MTPGNEGIVHHIVVFQCFNKTGFDFGYNGACNGNKPDEVSNCLGTAPVAAWAIGGTVRQSFSISRDTITYMRPFRKSGFQLMSDIRLAEIPPCTQSPSKCTMTIRRESKVRLIVNYHLSDCLLY